MGKQHASSNLIGYSAGIVQGVLYSTMGIFGKLLYATGLDAQQAMVLRFICTVFYLGLLLLIWRKYPLISKHPAIYVQSVMFFISAWTYLLAVQYMNAGLVTVVFYTFPAVVAVLNIIVFKEKPTWRIFFALVLSLVGIVFISGLIEPDVLYIDPLGMLFAVIACLSFAVYSVVIQKTGRDDSSFTATFSMSAVCMVACLVIFSPEVPDLFAAIDLYKIALSSGFAILATIVPIVLYIVSVNHIGATKASIISLVETPASLFLAWLILGETLSIWQGVGALCIMASVIAVTVKGSSDSE